MFPNDRMNSADISDLDASLSLNPTAFAPDELEPLAAFKVWVEFDAFGQPQRAAWGLRAPAGSVVQIETYDVDTARRTTAALKTAIRDRHSKSQVLGAALTGVY